MMISSLLENNHMTENLVAVLPHFVENWVVEIGALNYNFPLLFPTKGLPGQVLKVLLVILKSFKAFENSDTW